MSPTLLVDKVEKAIQEADVPPNFVVKREFKFSITDKQESNLFLVSEIGNPYNSGLENCINESVSKGTMFLSRYV